MRAVSDAGPINYLILIDAIDILPSLLGEVTIPVEVASELRSLKAPEVVQNWIALPPSWARVISAPAATFDHVGLGAGERAVISLGVSTPADLLLMDDRKAVLVARKFGLTTIGTIGLIDRAAALGLIDLNDAVARLRQTSFRASPALYQGLISGRHDNL